MENEQRVPVYITKNQYPSKIRSNPSSSIHPPVKISATEYAGLPNYGSELPFLCSFEASVEGTDGTAPEASVEQMAPPGRSFVSLSIQITEVSGIPPSVGSTPTVAHPRRPMRGGAYIINRSFFLETKMEDIFQTNTSTNKSADTLHAELPNYCSKSWF
jgi:hypothetical protein